MQDSENLVIHITSDYNENDDFFEVIKEIKFKKIKIFFLQMRNKIIPNGNIYQILAYRVQIIIFYT